jgi:hypothetical protein
MEALMAIALTCMVPAGSYKNNSIFPDVLTYQEVDSLQKKCQKALIECYEKKFPVEPHSKDKWVGGLKDCIKAR